LDWAWVVNGAVAVSNKRPRKRPAILNRVRIVREFITTYLNEPSSQSVAWTAGI
jgi:hypothetical protein